MTEFIECFVCCNKFTHKNKNIICTSTNCNFTSCTECFIRYSQDKLSIECMKCHTLFDNNFIDNNFHKSQISKIKEIQQKIFIQQQTNLITETVPRANFEIEQEKASKRLLLSETKRKELKLQIANLNKEIIKDEKLKLSSYDDEIQKKEWNSFIGKCPNTNCNAYLDKDYVCLSCKSSVCKKCMCIILDKKHKCNDDDIKTASVIKKTTKPCPKCRTLITKITGCNHMWCTKCHYSFDWTTGSVIKSGAGNPHYHNYTHNTGNTLRTPGDIHCGGIDRNIVSPKMHDLIGRFSQFHLPLYNLLATRQHQVTIPNNPLCFCSNFINIIQRSIRILNNIRTYLSTPDTAVFLKNRTDLIKGVINEQQFQKNVIDKNYQLEYYSHYIHHLEMFVMIGIEIINEFSHNLFDRKINFPSFKSTFKFAIFKEWNRENCNTEYMISICNYFFDISNTFYDNALGLLFYYNSELVKIPLFNTVYKRKICINEIINVSKLFGCTDTKFYHNIKNTKNRICLTNKRRDFIQTNIHSKELVPWTIKQIPEWMILDARINDSDKIIVIPNTLPAIYNQPRQVQPRQVHTTQIQGGPRQVHTTQIQGGPRQVQPSQVQPHTHTGRGMEILAGWGRIYGPVDDDGDVRMQEALLQQAQTHATYRHTHDHARTQAQS
jgi:hypothetical protein